MRACKQALKVAFHSSPKVYLKKVTKRRFLNLYVPVTFCTIVIMWSHIKPALQLIYFLPYFPCRIRVVVASKYERALVP